MPNHLKKHRESRRKTERAILLALIIILAASILIGIPSFATRKYGRPSSRLDYSNRLEYSARLLWYGGQLIQPLEQNSIDQSFIIEPGESIYSIASRLEEVGLIHNESAFRTYLIFTGIDTSIQAGEHILSPAMSTIDIARSMQDVTPGQITFIILPGWRMEEIAASLPTSGLNITPEAFLETAKSAPHGLDFLPASASTEGFLYPDAYILSRETTTEELVSEFLLNFSLHLTTDLRNGFARQDLDTYQAVTIASILQREAVIPEEQPQIASVFINRWNVGMKLDSDPTVQYALGYNSAQGTWWTNPLSAADLKFDSHYNTYVYTGLPPGPIANPSLRALQAVASPADTPYFFFRARCDRSGLHVFAVTFEEHIQNACQ